jgi:hypothetical protein
MSKIPRGKRLGEELTALVKWTATAASDGTVLPLTELATCARGQVTSLLPATAEGEGMVGTGAWRSR